MTALLVESNCPYSLRCVRCGWQTSDRSYILHCPDCGREAFLRTQFHDVGVDCGGDEADFYSFRSWLSFDPLSVGRELRIGCVRAGNLGSELGLTNLWLLLSCYCPQYGADLPTGTFKGLEALGVFSRVFAETDKTLIISSAGNAGVAFLEIGASLGKPAVVVVPEVSARYMMVSSEPSGDAPLLICLRDAYYPDAIKFVDSVIDRFSDRMVREGGAFNVARRDAMAIPVHRAIRAIGRIPDHYFQAVGSGTGAIAAMEAVSRLVDGKVCPPGRMRLHLVQNDPFTPMVDAFKSGEREVAPMGDAEIHDRLSRTHASMLSNASPPYGLAGGVHDCLVESGGQMYAVGNDAAVEAGELVRHHFSFVPCPEACVAMAGLIQARSSGAIGRDDVVLLHVTGGGWEQSVKELNKEPYPRRLMMDPSDHDRAYDEIERYLSRST